jgi:replication initiation protein RepC
MQHISSENTPLKQGRGGRISSPRLRETLEQSQDFAGLEESVKHFDLLTLVKRAGKGAGFTPKMIVLLEHYMIFTREIDWQQGSQPIVYKSQYQTAMDLGVSERHIQRLEKQLFEVGALTWSDSGNHKRYGQRDAKTGKILYAFGVDLTPLAYLKAELENIVHEQQLYKAAWMESKRQISWHRAQIKSVLAEMTEVGGAGQGAFQASYDLIATPYRTSMSIGEMREQLVKHEALYNDVLKALKTTYDTRNIGKESCKADSNVSHKQDTNYNQSNKLDTNSSPTDNCFQGSSSQSSVDKPQTSELTDSSDDAKGESAPKHPAIQAGLEHITGKQLLNAASSRFRDHIPMRNGPMTMDDIVTAAYAMRSDLYISQKSWGRACQHLTRYGAAVCVLLLDQATIREENRVMKPAAYFNAMINRAITGDLHLQKSVMGLLKADETHDPANSNETDINERKA